MPKSIRFHLDENCDPRIAEGLRKRGIDVTTAAEIGLLQAGDLEHLEFAVANQRVIFTHDADFLRLAAAGIPHRGVVYCQIGHRSLGEIIRRLSLIWETYEPRELENRVEFL